MKPPAVLLPQYKGRDLPLRQQECEDSRTASMRLTARLLGLLVLISTHLAPTLALNEIVHCNQLISRAAVRSTSDCEAAIAIIPSPAYYFDSASPGDAREANPISVYLDHSSRNRTFALPAVFRSGSCLVIVHPIGRPLAPQLPVRAASAMNFQFWPDVKRVATMITTECRETIKNRDVGSAEGNVHLDGQPFCYDVEITGAPREMPRDGWKVRLGYMWYNVYEASEGVPALPPGHVRGFRNMYPALELPRFLQYAGPAVHVVTPVSHHGPVRGSSAPMH